MNPQNSPWGRVQEQRAIAAGIVAVTTAGHGGIWLSRERLDRMPAALRVSNDYSGAGSEWFEEDCEWALVAAAFPEAFPPQVCCAALQTIRGCARPDYMAQAGRWLETPGASAFLSRTTEAAA